MQFGDGHPKKAIVIWPISNEMTPLFTPVHLSNAKNRQCLLASASTF